MDRDIRQLALDALYNRSDKKSETSKSCFIFNEAGTELRACNADAIPALEELFLDVIVPAMEQHRKQNGIPDWNSMIQEGPPFAGLSEFIGAYWIICARSDPSRAIRFMRTMTRPVVSESVSLLAVYFHPANSLSNVTIPDEYIAYVKELGNSNVDEYRDVAHYVANHLHLNISATGW